VITDYRKLAASSKAALLCWNTIATTAQGCPENKKGTAMTWDVVWARIRRRVRRLVRPLKRKPHLSDDKQWDAWQKLLERIHQETVYTFKNRLVFREILAMFERNEELRTEGHFVWEWLRGTYGRDQALAVRREADRGSDVINLIQLMYQMSKHSEVMSRVRYKAHFPPDTVIPEDMQDDQFTQLCGKGDYMNPKILKRDRRRLEKDCWKVVDYANKAIAHRTEQKRDLTITEVHKAMDAIEQVHKKYYVLLTGGGLMQAEPAIQFNWKKVFTKPWIT
jgi:hypothetical protein